MVKSVTKEVPASDSESEQPKSAKKSASVAKNASNNKGHAKDEAGASGSGSGDEDEEEYEIETILDARPGAFEGERVGYLVKWKGYGEEHNSWVDEKDAEGAREVIDEYWRKLGKKAAGRKSDVKAKTPAKPRKSAAKDDEDEEASAPPAKKRGRPPKSQARPPSEEQDEDVEMEDVPKKKLRKSTGKAGRRGAAATEDQDDEEYTDMKKWKELNTWEHLVESIDTVERTDNNELLVYFTLKNGKGHGRETSEVCKHKLPFKLIEFYESNLRWKPTDEDAMQE